jgi:cation transport regulator ChaB
MQVSKTIVRHAFTMADSKLDAGNRRHDESNAEKGTEKNWV